MAAFHLTEAGLKTVVIDQRDIGTGSTSASTALLQYEVDVPLRELIKKIGPEAAGRSCKVCRGAIGKVERLAARLEIKCGFERKPSCSENERGAQSSCESSTQMRRLVLLQLPL